MALRSSRKLGRSGKFKASSGVKQGVPSPVLSLTVMDEIVDKVRNRKKRTYMEKYLHNVLIGEGGNEKGNRK
jgi:hypothetical protein